MAARTSQPNDFTTVLHAGQVTVSVAGFTDPSGNPWILMTDTAAAVNGLMVTNGAAGTGPTISVGGAQSDTNPSITLVGKGTGATIVGSSVSPVTIAGTPTVSSNLAVSGTLTVTGGVFSSNMTASGLVTTQIGHTSSQIAGVQFGSSGPTILFGSSTPTASAVPGSLFLNAGGASGAILYYALANGGTASSSNWNTFTVT